MFQYKHRQILNEILHPKFVFIYFKSSIPTVKNDNYFLFYLSYFGSILKILTENTSVFCTIRLAFFFTRKDNTECYLVLHGLRLKSQTENVVFWYGRLEKNPFKSRKQFLATVDLETAGYGTVREDNSDSYCIFRYFS